MTDARKWLEPGMMVWWYPGGERNQEPYPALVTGVGDRSLCLHVMSKEIKNFQIKDGVRHVDDESARKPELLEMGAWDHTPFHKRLFALLAELGAHSNLPAKKSP